MITKPTSFVKPKIEGLKESEFDKKGNTSRSTSKKVKANFSSSSLSKEKVQVLFKSDKEKIPQKIIQNAEKSRRNFTEVGKRRDGNQSFLTDYYMSLSKIYDLYTKKLNVWIKEFIDMMNNEKSIDISSMIPTLKDNIGENLLINSKFWILFIEFKKSTTLPRLTLDNCVEIFNESLKYELNDIKLIHDFFMKIISSYGGRNVYDKIKKNNFSDKIPEKYDNFSVKHYRFLLHFPDHFSDDNLKKENLISTQGKRSKFNRNSTIENDDIKKNQENFNLLLKRNSLNFETDLLEKDNNIIKDCSNVNNVLEITSFSLSIDKDGKIPDLTVSNSIEISINNVKVEPYILPVKENSFLIMDVAQGKKIFKQENLSMVTEIQDTFSKGSDIIQEEITSINKVKKYRSRNKSKKSKISITEESDEEKNSEKEETSIEQIDFSKKKNKRKKRNKK